MSESQPDGKITGSCACGKVAFVTNYVPQSSASCYCTQCRKCSGNDRLPFVNFPTSEITWDGRPDVWQSSDFAERGFCATCGSSIYMLYHFEKEEIGINTGCIDSGFEFIPATTYHIFVEDKPPWATIPDDGARRVEGFGLAFREKVKKWQERDAHPTAARRQ